MRKALSMSIVFVLALILASAFAMWSDVLKTNVAVSTGDVDVSFDGYKVVEGAEYGKPWVANCIVDLIEVEDEDLNNPAGDNDLDLAITIENGYPGYSCTIYFNVTNTGTIPVIGPFYEMPEIPEGLEVVFNPMPSQLHPGDKAEYTVYVEVLQEAKQKNTYEIQIHLKYIQWNEVEVEIEEQPLTPLTVSKEFRETDTDFKKCPANLGSPLNEIKANVKDGKIKSKSISPGAFFGVIRISGVNITRVNITDTYDFHFDVKDSHHEVRVYLLDGTGCVTELRKDRNYSYTVDNTNNVVTVSINLDRALGTGETILVYLKFKPAPGLVGSSWDNLTDRWFNNTAYVETNIGSTSASASIEIVKK